MEKRTHHPIPNTTHTFTIEQGISPARIDSILAQKFSELSRSYFQRLIKQKHVLCNKKTVDKASMLVQAGDVISIFFPPAVPQRDPRPLEKSAVEVIYEHPDFLIINKPAGLTVHDPSNYHTKPTLVDWLIQYFKEISEIGSPDRPGIVHRLDQFTSGIMVIPRTSSAHKEFGNMFRNRSIHKQYLAVVEGHPDREGTINFPISRHPQRRTQMTHKQSSGRSAITHYSVIEYYNSTSLVHVKPVTGRTHQIRVHMSALGHPIIGDEIYGTPSKYIKRQALHAYALSFNYNNIPFRFSCNVPSDMQKLIEIQKKI